MDHHTDSQPASHPDRQVTRSVGVCVARWPAMDTKGEQIKRRLDLIYHCARSNLAAAPAASGWPARGSIALIDGHLCDECSRLAGLALFWPTAGRKRHESRDIIHMNESHR